MNGRKIMKAINDYCETLGVKYEELDPKAAAAVDKAVAERLGISLDRMDWLLCWR